jgi:hypothetical protein
VRADVAERKFLATGELTRAVYSESCTFVDEIDTYTLDKWIAGTGRLFDGAASSVSLVGDAVASSPTQLSFRFDETLQFNIPFKPRSHLTGTVTLTRDPGDGLITEYVRRRGKRGELERATEGRVLLPAEAGRIVGGCRGENPPNPPCGRARFAHEGGASGRKES